MIPVDRWTLDTDFEVTALEQASLDIAMSNSLGAIVRGADRPITLYSIEMSTHKALLDLAMREPAVWTRELHRQVYLSKKLKAAASDDAWKVDERTMLEAMPLLMTAGPMGKLDEVLSSPASDIPSHKKWLIKAMAEAGVSHSFGRMPATAFAIETMDMKLGLNDKHEGYFCIPAPCSPQSVKCAEMLLALDTNKFSRNVLPAQANAGHHDRRDTLGKAFSISDQLVATISTYVPFSLQLGLLAIAASEPMLRYDLAKLKSKVTMPAEVIDDWENDLNYCLAQDTHWLVSFIASGMGKSKAYTDFKEQELLWVPTACFGSWVVEAKANFTQNPRLERMLREMLKARGLQAKAYWGGDACASSCVTIPEFAAMIRSIKDIIPEMSNQVKLLGWRPMRIAPTTIRQNGADFALCDGRGYSDPPGGLLLGLKPCLSAGNFKIFGTEELQEKRFNVEQEIQMSTVVSKNYGQQMDTEYATNFYIPIGSLMGEGGWVATRGRAGADNHAGEAASFYNSKVGSLIKYGYHMPALETDSKLGIYKTEWDGYAIGSDEKSVNSNFEKLYDGSVEPKIEATNYAHSTVPWGTRILVRLSRVGRPVLLGPTGVVWRSLDWRGGLAYNDENVLSYTSGEIDMLIEAALESRAGR